LRGLFTLRAFQIEHHNTPYRVKDSVDIAFAAAFALPLAPINSAWFKMAKEFNGDFQCEEIGWPELVETVAHIRDSLPRQDRVHLGILATNYGEAGAVNLYGTQYGLPRAISGVNSFSERDAPTSRPYPSADR
jgi:hypothetical protein